MSGYDNIIISSVNVTHIYSVESAVDLPKAGSAKYQKEPQYERMEVYMPHIMPIIAHVIALLQLAIEFLFCLVLTEVLTKV